MIINAKANDILITGSLYPGLKIGLTKSEIEKVLLLTFGKPDIETPDLEYYLIDTETGIVLTIIFDPKGICYEIKIDFKENKDLNLTVEVGEEIENINEHIPFEKLIEILSLLNIEWEFDRSKIYLQTICIRLKNGLRLYYAFGDRVSDDYGFFSLRLLLETHTL